MSKGGNLEISNNVIKFGDNTYQIQNIVRLGKSKTKVNRFGYLFLAAIIASGSIFIGNQSGGEEAAFVGLAISAVLILVMMFQRPRYMLTIETNSGCGELLLSKKERFIDDLLDLISLVMDNTSGGNIHYNVDMSDHSVKETVMGDNYSNVHAAVITTRIGSVGGDIVGGDKIVAQALRPVTEAIEASRSDRQPEARQKMAALEREMAKGKNANDGVIANLVDGIVDLVPTAASAVVSAFATPILAAVVGPVTKFVLDKLRLG